MALFSRKGKGGDENKGGDEAPATEDVVKAETGTTPPPDPEANDKGTAIHAPSTKDDDPLGPIVPAIPVKSSDEVEKYREKYGELFTKKLNRLVRIKEPKDEDIAIADHTITIPLKPKETTSLTQAKQVTDKALEILGFHSKNDRKAFLLTDDSMNWNISSEAMQKIVPELGTEGFDLTEHIQKIKGLENVAITPIGDKKAPKGLYYN